MNVSLEGKHNRSFFPLAANVDQVTEKSIRSDAVLQTTRTIEVLEDPELEALGDEGRHGVNLEVQLQDGRSYTQKILHAKGSDKHPMTRQEVLQKFRLLASRVLSRSRVEQLENTLLNLEKLPDARKIAKLLIP